jgi:hypothetical protein
MPIIIRNETITNPNFWASGVLRICETPNQKRYTECNPSIISIAISGNKPLRHSAIKKEVYEYDTSLYVPSRFRSVPKLIVNSLIIIEERCTIPISRAAVINILVIITPIENSCSEKIEAPIKEHTAIKITKGTT